MEINNNKLCMGETSALLVSYYWCILVHSPLPTQERGNNLIDCSMTSQKENVRAPIRTWSRVKCSSTDSASTSEAGSYNSVSSPQHPRRRSAVCIQAASLGLG